MVHAVVLLQHQGDPRFCSLSSPHFVVSFSGAVNPGHFEAVSGGGPPRNLLGPYLGPKAGEIKMPCLFLYDRTDKWYPCSRVAQTMDLYADRVAVEHSQKHSVPRAQLSSESVSAAQRFLLRFARQR
ncbi:Ovca2 [Symbiodinium sp. CCMP2592]|nr:Ovca2 [Symbiodinium sp. CCMP2592]